MHRSSRMPVGRRNAIVLLAALWLAGMNGAGAQEPVVYKSAVVALTDDPGTRAEFEQGLVDKAKTHHYDAVTSYDLEPDVDGIDDRNFVKRLAEQGVQAILMTRPAAVGPGATLQSVQREVSPEIYADMRAFAKTVSPSEGDDLIAVVHMAIYLLEDDRPELVSAGAVWLDEPVESREQGIERLQELILANVDRVRPQIRERLGLAPLE